MWRARKRVTMTNDNDVYYGENNSMVKRQNTGVPMRKSRAEQNEKITTREKCAR